MSERDVSTPPVRYRCGACAFEVAPPRPGVTPCPRCQAVGGHERVGVTAPGGDAGGA